MRNYEHRLQSNPTEISKCKVTTRPKKRRSILRNGGENLRLAVDCSELEKKLKRAEADSEGIVGSMKKAKKKKGILVNR
jgi:hypothetical protein